MELLTPNDRYDVLSHDGIGPSILLLAIVNVVRLVRADQADGISPLRLLLLSLRDVSLVRADHQADNEPINWFEFKPSWVSHVLVAIHVGITHDSWFEPRATTCNLFSVDHQVGIGHDSWFPSNSRLTILTNPDQDSGNEPLKLLPPIDIHHNDERLPNQSGNVQVMLLAKRNNWLNGLIHVAGITPPMPIP